MSRCNCPIHYLRREPSLGQCLVVSQPLGRKLGPTGPLQPSTTKNRTTVPEERSGISMVSYSFGSIGAQISGLVLGSVSASPFLRKIASIVPVYYRIHPLRTSISSSVEYGCYRVKREEKYQDPSSVDPARAPPIGGPCLRFMQDIGSCYRKSEGVESRAVAQRAR